MEPERRDRIRVAHRAALPTGEQRVVNGIEYDHKFIASTELLASDHGVILLDAWRWADYMKRPRWIANHDIGGWSGAKLNEISLGRAVHVAIESGLPTERVGESGKAMCVYVRYTDTPFAQEVRVLYEQGGLDDVSVRWDWRTEVTRNPYEEEAKKYGEGIEWICTHAELVELSAVMLGADSGAQIVRAGVVEAFERCRAKNLALPTIEQIIRASESERVAETPDAPFIDVDAVLADYRRPAMERLYDAYLRM